MCILLRSTPMVTSVWAISDERPVMITSAPISRDAVTVSTRRVGDGFVHVGDTRDVDDHQLGAVGADPVQQLLGQLLGPGGVQDTDDGQDQQPLAHLQDGGGELQQRVLLVPDDALALLHEAHATVLAIRLAAGS